MVTSALVVAVAAAAAAGTGAASVAYAKGKIRTATIRNDRARFIDRYLFVLTEV